MTKSVNFKLPDEIVEKLNSVDNKTEYIISLIEDSIVREEEIDKEKILTDEQITEKIKFCIDKYGWTSQSFLKNRCLNDVQLSLIQDECAPSMVTKDKIKSLTSITLWKQ